MAQKSIYRTTAIVVGIIYLAGFVVGIAGNSLNQSILNVSDRLSIVSGQNIILIIGALLWLMAAAGDAAHGILLFPILKRHSERIAVGYLAARIMDATLISIYVLFILIQIPLGNAYLKAVAPNTLALQALSNVFIQANLYAYDTAMIALGLAGLMLNYLFYRANLVPRWIAIWGLIGYAIIAFGMVSEIMGSGLGLISSYPGGLWEVFVGGWLIAKGFNASAFSPQATKDSKLAESVVAN